MENSNDFNFNGFTPAGWRIRSRFTLYQRERVGGGRYEVKFNLYNIQYSAAYIIQKTSETHVHKITNVPGLNGART